MPEDINIVIVEDNEAYTESLKELISLSERMVCTASYSSAEDCLDALARTEPLRADVVLLDMRLPGKSGLSLVPALRKANPKTNILVLTQNDNLHTTMEGVALGIAGYILKNSSVADIRRAIYQVHEGGAAFDPHLARQVMQRLTTEKPEDDDLLSHREQEVLELIAMGCVKKEIADHLGISYSAVALYTEKLYKKLDVNNAAAAIASAMRKGLIK